MGKVKGFKGFDKEMKCQGFQFEVGKTYEHEGEVKLCNRGFHFCKNPLDTLDYYNFSRVSIRSLALTWDYVQPTPPTQEDK